MNCADAMIADFVSARYDQTVGDAVKLLERHHIRALPIIDDRGAFLGLFSFDELLSALLPSSVLIGKKLLKRANLRLDFLMDGEPANIAHHLRGLFDSRLTDLMDSDVIYVSPETTLWEGMRMLVQKGSPIPVVTGANNRLIGLLTIQSVVKLLAGPA